jgi:cation channel sperm-associated protein 2
LANAFITLFQLITPDQWYNMELDFRKEVPSYYTLTFFLSWVWLGAFIFQNIFVGVMVKYFQTISNQMNVNDNKKNKALEINRQWNELQQVDHSFLLFKFWLFMQ